MKPNNITNPHLDEDIRRKSRYLIAFVLVLLGILILRLFFMQIINGSYYEELSRNNRVRIIPIPAPRGKIFDRDGVVLADNRPAFNVMVLPEDISKAEDISRRLAPLLDGRLRRSCRPSKRAKSNLMIPWSWPGTYPSSRSPGGVEMFYHPGCLHRDHPERSIFSETLGSHVMGLHR
jgi:penicillin-binding protein 2